MDLEYKVGGGFTAIVIGAVYPVEVWKKQCCGKPAVKVLTVAYFINETDAKKFVEEKNTFKMGA